MNYSYRAQGSISVFGTATSKVSYTYYTKFAIGTIVYSRHAAEHHGKLEALVLKKCKLLFNPRDVLYIDILNALWNERHLCSKTEAVALTIDYYERLAIQAENYLGIDR